MSLADAWRLSVAWYKDRLDPDFHGRTPDEAVAIFTSLGLTDRFWSLDAETRTP